MRKPQYKFFQRMNDIESEWNKRNVNDATAEPEWDEYERLLYAAAEFVCGI